MFKVIKASFESKGLFPRKRQHHKPHHALSLMSSTSSPRWIPEGILVPPCTTKTATLNLYCAATNSASVVKDTPPSVVCGNNSCPNSSSPSPSPICAGHVSRTVMWAHNRPETEKSEVSVVCLPYAINVMDKCRIYSMQRSI